MGGCESGMMGTWSGVKSKARLEHKDALKHEKIDWGTGPTGKDLCKRWQACMTTTGPFVLLLLVTFHDFRSCR